MRSGWWLVCAVFLMCLWSGYLFIAHGAVVRPAFARAWPTAHNLIFIVSWKYSLSSRYAVNASFDEEETDFFCTFNLPALCSAGKVLVRTALQKEVADIIKGCNFTCANSITVTDSHGVYRILNDTLEQARRTSLSFAYTVIDPDDWLSPEYLRYITDPSNFPDPDKSYCVSSFASMDITVGDEVRMTWYALSFTFEAEFSC